MKVNEIRKKYLEFFKSRGHRIVPSASLLPENDPTTLFTTAGMHPLVPYLMGENHPEGNRIVNIQKCVRTTDIDEVGDATHHTFFEMMGNWSFGSYFKKESIKMSWEFLTSPEWLGLNKDRLAVSVFEGDDTVPFDKESFDEWRELGVDEKRIAKLGKKENWWGPAGDTGPCGPDTEIFYWVGDPKKVPDSFNDDNDNWVEVWNNVFMEFEKIKDGKYIPLKQKNVDTGMGLERITAVMNNLDDNYRTELFWLMIEKIEELSEKKYRFVKGDLGFEEMPDCWAEDMRSMRIIADHIKAATMIMGDDKGIAPSNTDQGYVVRRLIRRAIRYGKQLGIGKKNWTVDLAKIAIDIYKKTYSELEKNQDFILNEIQKEGEKFGKTLEKGLKKIDKFLYRLNAFKKRIEALEKKIKLIDKNTFIANMSILNELDETIAKEFLIYDNFKKLFDYKKKNIDPYKNPKMLLDKQDWDKITEKEKILNFIKGEVGNILKNFGIVVNKKIIFDLYQTDGFPIELAEEEFKKCGIKIDKEGFKKELQKHQELSRTASAGKFKGGLADSGEETKKLHTTAHLMLSALRKVLGGDVHQKGSNITAERLRFDFSYGEKLTDEQKAEVEKLVNEAIKKKLPVTFEEMSVEDARKKGAEGVFDNKYGDKVKVYKVGSDNDIFSYEICGGPHIENTRELGHFKIVKEKSSGAGVRRIKAILE